MPDLYDELQGTTGTAPSKPATQNLPQPEPNISTSSGITDLSSELNSGQSSPTPIAEKYKNVMNTDSSHNAQVLGISGKLGIEPSVAESFFDSAKKAAYAPMPEEVNNIVNQDPALAEYANNTKNLSAIHNDLPAHGMFVSAMRDLAKGVNQAAIHLINEPFFYTPEAYRTPFNIEARETFSDFFKENSDFISSPELNQNAFAEAKKGNLTPLIGQVAAGLPSTGVAIGLFALDPIAGGTYVFTDSYANSMQNNLQSGIAPTSGENLGALGKASIAAGTMFIPMHYLGNIYKGVSPEVGQVAASLVLKKALINNIGGMAGMSGANVTQTLSNALIDKATGVDPHAMDGIEDKLKGSALEGAVQWVVIGGIPTCVIARKNILPKGTTPESFNLDLATKQRDNFLKTFEASQKRKLIADNPDMAKKQTEDFQKNMGVSDVHIPYQEFQTLYQDKAEDIAKQIGPETKKSFDLAKSGLTNHVRTPLSELLNTKADIQVEKLADHIKVSPELPTVTEAKVTKDEAEKQQQEQEAKDKQTLEEFEKGTKEKIEGLGGQAGEGAATIAKAKTLELKNLARILGKPVSALLQLAKINILRAPKEQSFKEAYDESPGMATTADYLKRYGIKILLKEPEELTGAALDKEKLKIESQKRDLKNSEIPVTKDSKVKGATTLNELATSLFDAANQGEIDKTHLPQEWWDEGQSGRPDFANLDGLRELVGKGSGIESYQKYNQKMQEKTQEYHQKGIDPFGLKPKEETEIFGNTKKPSKADEIFNETFKKPNLNAKQQDIFPGEKEKGKEQQTLFQSKFTADDYKRMLSRQRTLEDYVATARDPETGKTWMGDEHSDAFKKAEAEGVSRYKNGGLETGFTKLSTGEFVSREKAEGEMGFGHSGNRLREMAELRDQINIYREGHRGRLEITGAAGEPQGREFNIYLEEGADKSTINHEFAHAFLQIFRDHVIQDDATPQAKEMEKQLFKMFGVDSWGQVTDRHSEMFARGWEYRLWEGKVPTAYQNIYNTFAKWMRKIYPSTQVMEQYLKNVGVKMDDSTREMMRKIYDRFIASSEEIEKAEKIMGYSKEAPKGLAQEELQNWQENEDKATNTAIDQINKRKMSQLTVDAKEQIAYERKRIEEQAQKDVEQLPVFKATDILKEIDDPKEMAGRYLKQQSDEKETDAINKTAEELGFASPSDLAYALTKADRNAEIQERITAHMDQFKETINAGPNEAKLATINEGRKDAVAHEISMMEQTISEMKGKMLGTELEKAQGKKVVTSMKETKPELTQEEAALKRKVALQQYHREKAQAKVEAEDAVKRIPLTKAMNVQAAVSDVKEATKRVKEFQDKGNTDKAQEWRRRQLRSMEMADLAKKISLEVMKKRNEMRKFARIEKKPLTMPNGHWLMIKSLLENTGLKPSAKVQDDVHRGIAQMMKEKTPDVSNDEIADKTGWYFTKSGALVPENLESFRDRMMDKDPDLAGTLSIPENLQFKNMTISDFRKLNTAIKTIYKNGRDENNLDFSWGQLKKNLAVDELTGKLKETQPQTLMNEIHKWTDNLAAPIFGHITRFSNVFDGGETHGPFNRLIVNPLLDGLAKRDGEKIDLLSRLEKVHDDHYPESDDKDHNKFIAIKTSKGVENFTKNEMKRIYAYMGQPDALKGLLTGNKYTLQDLRTIIDHLDENDLKYMENVGKELSKDFPRYSKLKMDLDGIEPEKAETCPIETKFGTRDGFYFPMKYKRGLWETMTDWGKHPLESTKELFSRRVAQMPFTHYGTQQGFLKSRTGVSGMALDTINSPLNRYVEDTSRFFGLQQVTKQVGKILNDKNFMQAMKDHVGPGPMALFRQMVEHVASAAQDESTALDKVFSIPRRLIFAHVIGFRPVLYPLKGFTDLGNVVFWGGEYGGLKALSAMKDHGYTFTFDMPDNKGGTTQYGFRSSGFRQLMDIVAQKDPMMKRAAINYDWNAMEMAKQFSPDELKSWIGKWTGKSFDFPKPLAGTVAFLKMNTYMMERNADRQIRFPLWYHTYTEARAKGMSEEDSIMDARKLVNDKLGSAEELYHVGPQRGSELAKQLAPVISFAANQFNQWWEHGFRNGLVKDKIARNPIAAAMIMTAATTAYYLYPSTLKWMLNEIPQHEHKDMKKRFEKDLNDEMFQGVPYLGYLKHGSETGKFGLPTLDWLTDNWKGLHTLKDIHHYTERDWQQALDAFTIDFPLPTSLETPTMNLIDHMNKGPGDEWKWQDYLSKRPIPKEKKARSFFK